jgi:hypothetical protein
MTERRDAGGGLTKPRLFAPGSAWSYSNTNYIALGVLIISEDLTRQLTLSCTGAGMEPPETGQVLAGLLT